MSVTLRIKSSPTAPSCQACGMFASCIAACTVVTSRSAAITSGMRPSPPKMWTPPSTAMVTDSGCHPTARVGPRCLEPRQVHDPAHRRERPRECVDRETHSLDPHPRKVGGPLVAPSRVQVSTGPRLRQPHMAATATGTSTTQTWFGTPRIRPWASQPNASGRPPIGLPPVSATARPP